MNASLQGVCGAVWQPTGCLWELRALAVSSPGLVAGQALVGWSGGPAPGLGPFLHFVALSVSTLGL